MEQQNNKPIRKTKGNYVFPNILAKMMKGVSARTQMEAEMASLSCILLGLTVMAIFTIFFTTQSIFIKIMIAFNCVAGFVFLSSRLTTSFQQYNAYLAAMGILETWNEGETQKINMVKDSNNI